MTDLSEFGGGLDEPETGTDEDDQDQESSAAREFHRSRCRVIKTNGQRCLGGTSGPITSETACPFHERTARNDSHRDLVTIHSHPVDLIEVTSGLLRSQFDEHLDAWELVKPAIHGAVGLEDEPLTLSEDGLWLPVRHRQAARLIIRTPTATVDSRRGGGLPREAVFAAVTVDYWTEDYLADEGRTAEIRNEECLASNHDDGRHRVGLKIQGEPQEWYPVEIVDAADGGADD